MEGIQNSLVLSLGIGLASTVVVAIVGLPLALALAKPSWRGRTLMDILVNLPLALPPSVLGYYLLLMIGQTGPIGLVVKRLGGRSLIFSPTAAVMAAAVVSLPLFVQAARNAIEEVPPEIYEAAQLCGASKWDCFRKMTLPLSWPGIVTGALLAYARSLGEFGATLMVAGNIPGRTQTMSLAIYSAVQAGHLDTANRLALILTGVAAISIWAGLRWRNPRRRQRRASLQ